MIDTTHIADSLQHGAKAAADSLHGAADTLHAAGAAAAHGGGHGGGKAFTELLHHLQDSHELELPFLHIRLPQFPPVHILGITIDFSITKHVAFLWIAALLQEEDATNVFVSTGTALTIGPDVVVKISGADMDFVVLGSLATKLTLKVQAQGQPPKREAAGDAKAPDGTFHKAGTGGAGLLQRWIGAETGTTGPGYI